MKLPKLSIPLLKVNPANSFDALCFAAGVRMQQLAATSPDFRKLLDQSGFSLQFSLPEDNGRVYVIKPGLVKQYPAREYIKKFGPADFRVEFRNLKTAFNILGQCEAAILLTAIQTGLVKTAGGPEHARWLLNALPLLKIRDLRKIGMDYFNKAQHLLNSPKK